jgi:hypothetical protein
MNNVKNHILSLAKSETIDDSLFFAEEIKKHNSIIRELEDVMQIHYSEMTPDELQALINIFHDT